MSLVSHVNNIHLPSRAMRANNVAEVTTIATENADALHGNNRRVQLLKYVISKKFQQLMQSPDKLGTYSIADDVDDLLPLGLRDRVLKKRHWDSDNELDSYEVNSLYARARDLLQNIEDPDEFLFDRMTVRQTLRLVLANRLDCDWAREEIDPFAGPEVVADKMSRTKLTPEQLEQERFQIEKHNMQTHRGMPSAGYGAPKRQPSASTDFHARTSGGVLAGFA